MNLDFSQVSFIFWPKFYEIMSILDSQEMSNFTLSQKCFDQNRVATENSFVLARIIK